MIRSMTGYGKGVSVCAQGVCTVEIRSVNHRYGEVTIKIPRSFIYLENRMKRQVASVLKRGKTDVFVLWEEATPLIDNRLDPDAARGWHTALAGLAGTLGIDGKVSLDTLISLKGVIREQKTCPENDGETEQCLMDALEQALQAMDRMRTGEGNELLADISARKEAVCAWVAGIRDRTATVAEECKQRLTARLSQLMEGLAPDPARILQEAAIIADRSDITEETVRLESHFRQFDETLGSSDPVGRKLDFILQEMNREINTIGSKANDADIAALVVLVKSELEKIREQVQNIE